MGKDCKEVQKEMALYAGEKLPGTIEQHLEQCRFCRKYWADLQESQMLLQNLAPLEPPPSLSNEIQRRLESMEEAKQGNWIQWMSRKVSLPTGGLIAAMLIIILGFGGLFLQMTGPGRQDDLYYGAMLDSPMALESVRRTASREVEMDMAADPEKGMEPKIIYTGYMQIRVDDLEKAWSRVLDMLSIWGGYASETRRWTGSNEDLFLRMVLRVPSSKFNEVMEEAAGWGFVEEQSSQGRDITQEYYDLEARLNSKKEQEKRYLEILQEARSVDDILRVERELERIRGDIESMEGTLRYYSDRTDMATITLNFKEPGSVAVGHITSGLFRDLADSFLRSLRGLLLWVSNALPWIISIGVVLIIIVLIRRRRA